MNRQQFLDMMDKDYVAIRKINEVKGHDYAGDNDALANFKRGAERLGVDPELIWAIYADKHWSAVMTYVQELEVKSEPIEGRLYDVILYCFLMLGLVREREKRNAKPPVAGGGFVSKLFHADESVNIPWAEQPPITGGEAFGDMTVIEGEYPGHVVTDELKPAEGDRRNILGEPIVPTQDIKRGFPFPSSDQLETE